jgi:hypothetical protein
VSVRGYDSFLVTANLGANRKVRRLTPAERWCAVHGVWAIAAESPHRGQLWIADGVAATEKDYAELAGVSIAVAKSTVRKMRELGMLEPGDGAEYVHDWDQHQREPKPSDSPESRRERKRASRARHAKVTRDIDQSHAPEVEDEGKDEANASSTVEFIFDHWRSRCGHPKAKLDAKRRRSIAARLREGVSVDEVKAAIEGAVRAAFVSDTGQRFDDIELICRNRPKLDSFITRADAKPSLAAADAQVITRALEMAS